MNWFVYAVISAIATSLFRVFQKKVLSNTLVSPVLFSFLFGLIIAFIMFIWALTEGITLPNLMPILPNIIAMTFLYCFANVFLFHAFIGADSSEVTILLSTSTIWTVISSIVFLKESFSLIKIISTIFIIAGIVIVYYSKKKWHINKSHIYALISAVCFGLAFTNDAYTVKYFNSISTYTFLAFLLQSLSVIFFEINSLKQIKIFTKAKNFINLFLACIFCAISTICTFLSFQNGGQASIVAPISQMSVIIIIFIGYIFLK